MTSHTSKSGFIATDNCAILNTPFDFSVFITYWSYYMQYKFVWEPT